VPFRIGRGYLLICLLTYEIKFVDLAWNEFPQLPTRLKAHHRDTCRGVDMLLPLTVAEEVADTEPVPLWVPLFPLAVVLLLGISHPAPLRLVIA
jgi:hypothetical protein